MGSLGHNIEHAEDAMVSLHVQPEWVGIVFRNADGTYTAVEMDYPRWSMTMSYTSREATNIHIEVAGQARKWEQGQSRTRNPRYQEIEGRPMIEAPEGVTDDWEW